MTPQDQYEPIRSHLGAGKAVARLVRVGDYIAFDPLTESLSVENIRVLKPDALKHVK